MPEKISQQGERAAMGRGGVVESETTKSGLQLQFVRLEDGRRICYREAGVPGPEAERQLLVLHGWGSSRLAGMPGVSPALLAAYRVRLVAIDRPGYGRSDIDRNQSLKSSAKDIEDVADALEMGDKFFLLGFSGGGASCWASARYIPHRIAGIVGWAPMGSYNWKGITTKERKAWLDSCAGTTGFLFGKVGRRIPNFILRNYTRHGIRPGPAFLERMNRTLSEPDKEHMRVKEYASDGSLLKDVVESRGGSRGYGMYKDFVVWNRNWGFEPEDVTKDFKGKFHIWQGTKDNLVPLGLQRWVKDKVPELVELHELPNEGHLSWFNYNDEGHRLVFAALFGETIEVTG